MGRRYSNIKRAVEYEQGLNGYIRHLQGLDSNPTVRTTGTRTRRTKKKPRRLIAIRPFGQELQGGELLETQVTREAFEKLQGKLTGRIQDSSQALGGAVRNKSLQPAKVTFFDPGSGEPYYEESKITGLHYLKYPGESYTSPFGATGENEEEYQAAKQVKAAVLTLSARDYARVSITPEKLRV